MRLMRLLPQKSEAQNLAVLFSEIEAKKSKKESIELILRVEGRKRDKVARELEHVGKVTRVFKYIPYVSVLCPPEDAERMANSVYYGIYDKPFYSIPIRNIEVSGTFSMLGMRANSKAIKTENRWNLENIGVYNAWTYSKGSGTKIAIIDTGVNYNHPELKDRFTSKKGYDFVRGTEEPMDRNGHGTHVAGIAASTNYGIAIESTLYSVRVLDENGLGSESGIAAGIEWCLDNEVDIANMSLGAPVASKAFADVCNVAYRKGLILVAAAGNSGDVRPNYPAAFGEPVIAVAAVDKDNEHAQFSTIYPTNDISAPGVEILAPYLNGYKELSGTSMASPHIAGVLGLGIALSREKNLESLLKSTAKKLDSELPFNNSWLFGSGLVMADKMMEGVVGNLYGTINRYLKGNSRENVARAAAFAMKIWEI